MRSLLAINALDLYLASIGTVGGILGFLSSLSCLCTSYRSFITEKKITPGRERWWRREKEKYLVSVPLIILIVWNRCGILLFSLVSNIFLHYM